MTQTQASARRGGCRHGAFDVGNETRVLAQEKLQQIEAQLGDAYCHLLNHCDQADSRCPIIEQLARPGAATASDARRNQHPPKDLT